MEKKTLSIKVDQKTLKYLKNEAKSKQWTLSFYVNHILNAFYKSNN